MTEKTMKWYRQEGKLGAYQIMLAGLACGNAMKKYLSVSYGDICLFVRNNFGQILLNEENMGKVAHAFFALAKDSFPTGWEEKWRLIDKELTALARKISVTRLEKLSNEELWGLYQKMLQLDEEMWAISIFIDVFDAGFDQVEIEKIKSKYNFDFHEVQTLLAPSEVSYINQWEKSLDDFKNKKITFKDLYDQFFWYRTDYTEFGEITEEFIHEEIKNIKYVELGSPLEEQKLILEKHKLSKNPLKTFQILATWRDERKRLNFTGIHGLIKLLREGLRRQNIDPELGNGLIPQEAREVFVGTVNKEILQKRMTDGFFITLKENGSFKIIEGIEGEKEFKRLESTISIEEKSEIKGMIACKGNVIGKVKIVLNALDKDDADKFEEGDILVTSMTRPEFLLLMKKAAAIVTNEGGISCHAAIIARELNIPCIIGTKIATKVLKDGDMVEVDANVGVVKIIK